MLKYILIGFLFTLPLTNCKKDVNLKEEEIIVDMKKIELLAEAIYNECGNCTTKQMENVAQFIYGQANLNEISLEEELNTIYTSYKYSYKYKTKSLKRLPYKQRNIYREIAFNIMYTEIGSDVGDRITAYGFTNYLTVELFESNKKPCWARKPEYIMNDGVHIYLIRNKKTCR